MNLNSGRKDDSSKTRFDLIPVRPLAAVARVVTFGANKYGDDNWHKVISPNRRYYAACLRHLVAWRLGEKADPDTGESHLAHAICCLFFILSRSLGFDPELDT